MPCYHPLDAYQIGVRPNGKALLKITRNSVKLIRTNEGLIEKRVRKSLIPKGKEELRLNCGKCIGCRLDRSRQWAIRGMNEASLHEKNCFITLTFDNDHLDKNLSLKKRDFQTFIKRLRKKYTPKCPYKKSDPSREKWIEENTIRYFHCGEYGENFGRPHHHAILFNFDFPDKKQWTIRQGKPVWKSKELDKLWPQGLHEIGSCEFESVAYIARYVTKKVLGEDADKHYQGREPEYNTMSRRPGIGARWFDKYKDTDVFPRDYMRIRDNIKVKPPSYYTKRYELTNPEEYANIKEDRKESAKASPDNSRKRLQVREKCEYGRFKQLKRSLT